MNASLHMRAPAVCVTKGTVLGATVTGPNLERPLSDQVFGSLLEALGKHGVLHFPDQDLTAPGLKSLAQRFGEIQVSAKEDTPRAEGIPEVSVLSNMKNKDIPLGVARVGEEWHTDMSYRKTRGFVNLLYGIRIPRRGGIPLGATRFANMRLAYLDLPDAVKLRLQNATALHSQEAYYERVIANGNPRARQSEQHRQARPPVSQPVLLTHPVTGEKVLYANPGFTVHINGWDPESSAEMLAFLFSHQTRPEYQHVHSWNEKDLLIWDNLSTIHRAETDYGPQEYRMMYRCQVLANRLHSRAGFHEELGREIVPLADL